MRAFYSVRLAERRHGSQVNPMESLAVSALIAQMDVNDEMVQTAPHTHSRTG